MKLFKFILGIFLVLIPLLGLLGLVWHLSSFKHALIALIVPVVFIGLLMFGKHLVDDYFG